MSNTKKIPTLTFKHDGVIYSITNICEATNRVAGALTENGHRLRGRPKMFNMTDIGELKVRKIHRLTGSERYRYSCYQ